MCCMLCVLLYQNKIYRSYDHVWLLHLLFSPSDTLKRVFVDLYALDYVWRSYTWLCACSNSTLAISSENSHRQSHSTEEASLSIPTDTIMAATQRPGCVLLCAPVDIRRSRKLRSSSWSLHQLRWDEWTGQHGAVSRCSPPTAQHLVALQLRLVPLSLATNPTELRS